MSDSKNAFGPPIGEPVPDWTTRPAPSRAPMEVRQPKRRIVWLSILHTEWPEIRSALEEWLEPRNFDGEGRQQKRLQALMPPSKSAQR